MFWIFSLISELQRYFEIPLEKLHYSHKKSYVYVFNFEAFMNYE